MTPIKTQEEFQQFVNSFYENHKKPRCFGICRANMSRIMSSIGNVISVNYPYLNHEQNFGSFAVFISAARLANSLADSDFNLFEEHGENEIVVDINLYFVAYALYFYYPFIMEILKDSCAELKSDFEALCEKITNNQSLQESDLEFLIELGEIEIHEMFASHKNIQVLLGIGYELMICDQDDPDQLANQYLYQNISDGEIKFQFCAFFQDLQTQSLQIAYMKLHMLSAGYAPLRSLNLDSIFSLLPNLAWSGNTPYEVQYLRENEISLKINNTFPCIDFIDKFPRYLMQVLPQADNIRILDSAKTRFGAFLGAGYTQMPGASYVNFNAGALGACMNEGRISSSVIVGEGTDIGGGASILGVLSGGNATPISIGKNCLLGANSVTGISLGDGCIVDAGISILAGSIVQITQEDAEKIKEVNACFEPCSSGLYKGHQLSGLHGLHFRTTTQNSHLIAFRSTREIALNKDLH